MMSRNQVHIVEVGPRDGLQNITRAVPTATKVELIQRLIACGLQTIELTSAVSPKAIPQLADSSEVLRSEQIQQLLQLASHRLPVLVPNLKGLELVTKHGVKEIAVFVSASEGFSKRNNNCSVVEGLSRARAVAQASIKCGMEVRGYISCIFQDPFDGSTPKAAVLHGVRELLAMGCYEVSLGDTLGVGTAADVHQLLTYLYCSGISAGSLACHFHDTYGQAVNNVWTAYQLGVRTFDSSVGGLGGCPFAPGAKGNVATEDLVYLFERAGINTGVELASLAQTGSWISEHLRKQNDSRAGAALVRKQAHPALNSKKDLKPKVKLLWQAQHGSDEVQIHYAKPNVKIVLNRPRNGNALTAEMILRLTKFFKAIRTDKTITRVVITANGKFFCTGMDLSKANSPVARNQNASTEQFSRLTELFEAIDNIPQVTIAAVNGPAFGGGVGLAFICDIRIFTSSATVTLSEVKLGLCPATISRYLMREWPTAFAREAMLTGRPIPAQQLLTLGLIAQIVDKNHTLADTIDEYLVQLRRAAPRASTLCKDLVKLSEVGGTSQMAGIRATFNEMMRVDSESAFGLMEFQAGKKDVDWDAYVLAKPKPKL